MRTPLPEIIDRITILRLKIENSISSDFKKEFENELEVCEEAVEEFRKEGVKINPDWIEELYEINRNQWGLESSMRAIKDQGDLEAIGRIYIELQISNKKRVAVKNKITEETGIGFKDIKIN